MEAVIDCPPLAGGLFDMDVKKRSIKIQRVGYGRASMADVVNILRQNKVKNIDVETFSVGDEGTTVTFRSEETIRLVTNLKIDSREYKVVQFGKQAVGVKVHWLPVFVAENCVRAILAPYGKVLSVERIKSKLGELQVNNGQWFVTLEMNEVQKNQLPHLFRFACGNKALITVRGRPPLCLRCHKVGHMRNACDGYSTHAQSFHEINRSFAQVLLGNQVPNQEAPEIDEEYGQIMEQRQQNTNGSSPGSDHTSDSEEKIDDREEEEEKDEEEEKSKEDSEGESEMEAGEVGAGVRGAKRPSDEQDYVPSSFDENFPPNRPAKKASRKAGGSARSGVEEVLTSNSFSLLAEFAESPAGGDI